MKYKMNYRFYLDKRFKSGVDLVKVRRQEKEGKDIARYLNPKENSIYIGVSHDGQYIKASTGIRVLSKQFDVKNQRVKPNHVDCVELNVRLEHLKQSIISHHYSLVMKGKSPSVAGV
jgi:hypothetical protein